MTRRRRNIVIFICLAIVAALATVLLWNVRRNADEPTYAGKPLSAWLDDRVATPAGPVVLTDDAVRAVEEIGPAAIPSLLDWIQRSDFPGTWSLHYVARLPIPLNDEWRTRAFYGFRALGDEAAAAIPELVQLALYPPSEDVQRAAINSLTNNLPMTVELLTEALTDSDADLRLRAANVLQYIRPPEAIEPLTSALGDSDARVRRASAKALRFYSYPTVPDTTLAALQSLLADPDSTVRAAAQDTLDTQAAYRKSLSAPQSAETSLRVE